MTRQDKTRQDKTRQDNHKTTTRQPQDNHKTILSQDTTRLLQDKTMAKYTRETQIRSHDIRSRDVSGGNGQAGKTRPAQGNKHSKRETRQQT